MMPRPAVHDVTVWDPLVRIIHWSMVASVSIAWLITEGNVHDAAGYALLFLIGIRILWGFIGPERARFSSFVVAPRSVLHYARQLRSGGEPRHIGHNPLGGWMIVALLAFTLAGSASGALYVTDRFWGEAWVIRAHAITTWVFVGLVPLHIAGVVHASWMHRESLVRAMIDGHKEVE